MPRDVLQGRRVLIVEDDMMIMMLLEDILEELGCCIAGAVSRIPAALAAIESDNMIEVAVLDVNLDGEMSFPVADALSSRGVPFFFATGYGEIGVQDLYPDRPVLQKPFRKEDIERQLQKILCLA